MRVSPEQLAAHLRVDQYGDFWLTEAIRPALDLQVVPRQGYRVETYRDAAKDSLAKDDIPMGYKQFVKDYFDSIELPKQ